MTEQEKIEGMEKIIFDYVDSKGTNKIYLLGSNVSELAKPFLHNYGVAEYLYNAGYRKADEVRKETAKEIMQMLKDGVKYGWTKCLDITYEEIKERYGVEVEA